MLTRTIHNLTALCLGFAALAAADTLTPNVLNLVVGETHAIQALNGSGQPITGLTWTSSDPNVVSLSTDNPPVLTAVSPGHATITAGTSTANVTVYAVALPVGTVIWSNPGNASGVSWIAPAVPSPTGVADVFAFQGDGSVQGITSDGIMAWTADVSTAASSVMPDFLGGLVFLEGEYGSTYWVVALDGVTGQRKFRAPVPASPGFSAGLAVHPDGTIFSSVQDQNGVVVIVGIDGVTGAQKFNVRTSQPPYPTTGLSRMIIAGDGYAYALTTIGRTVDPAVRLAPPTISDFSA